jgi:uncharacterized membrane protein YkvA (DUF1232 family)
MCVSLPVSGTEAATSFGGAIATRAGWQDVACDVSSALRTPAGQLTVPAVLQSCRMLWRMTSLALEGDVMLQPLELQLSIGATSFLRTVRRSLRRVFKFLTWSAKEWARWSLQAFAFMLLAAAISLVDLRLARTWRDHGFRAFRGAIALGLAVFVRLLADRRAPAIGKGLLALAIIYGVARADLVPDYLTPVGFIDDVAAVALASRYFMRLCPQELVEAHAARAARARYRSLRDRFPHRRITESEYS